MSRLDGKTRAVLTIPGKPYKCRRTSSRSIIQGVWAPPKLLAEAKSDENERTKAESVGSNTPWAYRPGEFGSHGLILSHS